MTRIAGSEQFEVRVRATAERLVGLRRALAWWTADTPLPEERREDVLLASYEAMANAAEHAYPEDDAGPLVVGARCRDDELTVVVADEGLWRPPDPTDTLRGRGLLLMEALADAGVTLHRGHGTTVTLRFRLALA